MLARNIARVVVEVFARNHIMKLGGNYYHARLPPKSLRCRKRACKFCTSTPTRFGAKRRGTLSKVCVHVLQMQRAAHETHLCHLDNTFRRQNRVRTHTNVYECASVHISGVRSSNVMQYVAASYATDDTRRISSHMVREWRDLNAALGY